MAKRSPFTREKAATLLSTSEPPPCVRFVLHDDRPVFRGALRAAAIGVAVAGAVLVGLGATLTPRLQGGKIKANQQWR